MVRDMVTAGIGDAGKNGLFVNGYHNFNAIDFSQDGPLTMFDNWFDIPGLPSQYGCGIILRGPDSALREILYIVDGILWSAKLSKSIPCGIVWKSITGVEWRPFSFIRNYMFWDADMQNNYFYDCWENAMAAKRTVDHYALPNPQYWALKVNTIVNVRDNIVTVEGTRDLYHTAHDNICCGINISGYHTWTGVASFTDNGWHITAGSNPGYDFFNYKMSNGLYYTIAIIVYR